MIETLHPGITAWNNQLGIRILRLHYSADEAKTPAWAAEQKAGMTNPAKYQQEYEVDFAATLGSLIYQLDAEATLEQSFPIPPTWTRRMGLDPHPSVPHAFLWVATDPYGDRWYYREFWPSKVCFRYDGDALLGNPGPCPEDDGHFAIKDYVGAIRWLESRENPQNVYQGKPFDERISARVIDYSARAFAAETREGQRQLSFQQLYELHMSGTCECESKCQAMHPAFFEDSKKDHAVGEELVNAGLKPITRMGGDGKQRKSSHIHIFKDRCPELIYQLQHARRQQLTPLQTQRMDPTGKAVQVRLHMVDDMRYLEMSKPVYLEPQVARRPYEPPIPGLGY